MKFLTALMSLVLLSLPTTPVLATTLQGLTQAQLIQQADLIVQVRPVSKASEWRGGRIFTNYTVDVSEYLLGEGPRTLQIELLGGEVNGIAQTVSGVPELPLEHSRLLFLKKHPRQSKFTPIQLGLGIFRYDEISRAWLPSTQESRVLGDTPQPLSVETLRNQIQSLRGKR